MKTKTQRMNRQTIARTCRLCLPAACMSLLAACAAKPIAQDLPSGEGTVAIKYLDSVTIDIIDDIRMKRRDFYEDAIKNRESKYAQGRQGAVDRVSTFAAAINANAQRDKSVLERYHADGERQLSALENSEELGDALLEHNKDVIDKTDELNAAKVQATKSDADFKEKINTTTTGAYETLIAGYQDQINGYNEKIKGLKEMEGEDIKEKIENKRNELLTAIKTLVEERITASATPLGTVGPSTVNDPLAQANSTTDIYDIDDKGDIKPGTGKRTKTTLDISQVPQTFKLEKTRLFIMHYPT